jgi:hypothetical protein
VSKEWERNTKRKWHPLIWCSTPSISGNQGISSLQGSLSSGWCCLELARPGDFYLKHFSDLVNTVRKTLPGLLQQDYCDKTIAVGKKVRLNTEYKSKWIYSLEVLWVKNY